MTAPQLCAVCRTPMVRRKNEALCKWRKRVYCSVPCARTVLDRIWTRNYR